MRGSDFRTVVLEVLDGALALCEPLLRNTALGLEMPSAALGFAPGLGLGGSG